MPIKYKKQQKGQALLLVVLILSVVLVVVLSVSSRSATDISVSNYDENALRAFSAAEAGVEEALLKNTTTAGTPVVVDTDANVSYSTVLTVPSSQNSFTHPEPVRSGQTRTFWFVSHNTSDESLTCAGGAPCTTASQLEVCWGTPGTPDNNASTPAIETTLYYDNTSGSISSPNNFQSVRVVRLTADPNSSRRTAENNFGTANSTCGFGGGMYAFTTGTVNLNANPILPLPAGCATSSGCLLMAKVRMLYNTSSAHSVGIRVVGGSGALPAQGVLVESTGTAGDSTRKVNVFRSYSEPQSIFDSGVFSLNDLTK